MNVLLSTLRRGCDDLAALDAPVALVGGLAVSARAEPRFTRDIDLAVGVADDADAERLLFALHQRGYRAVTIVEQLSTGRLATARLRPPGVDDDDGVLLDLLFASTGVEAEIVAQASPLTLVDSLSVPVAALGHLVAMKLLSYHPRRRPRDVDDLRGLRAIAGEADAADARALVDLITLRGFDRGRDLSAALDEWLAHTGPFER